MVDVEELANQYRGVVGLPPKFTLSGLSEIKAFTYRIMLDDGKNTEKEIQSDRVYAVGQKILDNETGLYGTITRVETVLSRTGF